jgi:hypothetical protein
MKVTSHGSLEVRGGTVCRSQVESEQVFWFLSFDVKGSKATIFHIRHCSAPCGLQSEDEDNTHLMSL